jgi:tetratricopeptide (TPR) repeat protein
MVSLRAGIFSTLLVGLLAACATGERPPGGEQLGEVRFQVSCSPEAQQKFHRAMALYHSFDWSRGKSAFSEIVQLDPRCGMAHWGLAMIASDNPFAWPVSLRLKEGAEAIRRAQELGAGTQRERDYIDALALLYKDHTTTPHRPRALAYEQAMEKLAARHTEDVEARMLYGLALSANHDLNDKTFARPLKAARILEPLFKAYPNHPGAAHYLIHSYDYPPIADKGLPAAQRYAKVAPDAAHAQHMPSHIFTRVGYWRESIAANKGSEQAAKGSAAATTHARDYMTYAYLQLAEDTLAEQVWADARKMSALKNPNLAVTFGLAAIPARLALERNRWADAAKLELHPGVSEADWKRFPQAESVLVYARAIGAARSGDAAGARRSIERLNQLGAALTARKLAYWAEQSQVQVEVATAWALRAEGKHAEALAQLRAAADHEDRTDKHVVTPGPIVPARELLGDMLMEMNRPQEALKAYEASIVKEPNRFRGLHGAALAAERAGDPARARLHYQMLAAMCAGSEGTRAELVRARQLVSQR